MIFKIEKEEYSYYGSLRFASSESLGSSSPSFRESVYAMVRERSMRASTQLPARERAFGRVNLSSLLFPAEYSLNIVRFSSNLSLGNESVKVCPVVALRSGVLE